MSTEINKAQFMHLPQFQNKQNFFSNLVRKIQQLAGLRSISNRTIKFRLYKLERLLFPLWNLQLKARLMFLITEPLLHPPPQKIWQIWWLLSPFYSIGSGVGRENLSRQGLRQGRTMCGVQLLKRGITVVCKGSAHVENFPPSAILNFHNFRNPMFHGLVAC